ncbi:MAG: 3-deoxy-7-phosphoheptulonate synthase class II [Planctomycetota bacterium]|nr:3-deoxy-7-phosphoheptulonate synthase class II [Planctomycetota bacterium]
MRDWTQQTWRERPVTHQPDYPDAALMDSVLEDLATLPPLVTSWEIETLKAQLAEAARGERFLLQGGDCAEQFNTCTPEAITNKLKILLQMSLVLVHGTRKRVIRVGRFAGQYAKPRSSPTEERDGQALASYFGDNVNSADYNEAARVPDPRRLITGYERSALTLNFIRSLIGGGFADLHHPEFWNLDFVQHSPRAAEYQAIVQSIGESVRFMETLTGISVSDISRVDFYTSHEGLLLPFESATTREVPRRHGWYNLGTHFPWIGMRTANVDHAHVEFYRGIRNPLAVKIGPETPGGDLPGFIEQLLDILHPDDEPGRLTLVHRYGAAEIEEHLPMLIDAVRTTGKTVLFVCDPMHGNTVRTSSGVKTRRFEDILTELERAIDIHAGNDSILGGVHFELTGDNVTECTGGARGLSDEDLGDSYQSLVDPRLNYEQSLEMAMLVAEKLGG